MRSMFSTEDVTFPAKLTAGALVDGVWLYDWTEQEIIPGTGLYRNGNSPRSGTSEFSPAYELNNAEVDTSSTPIVKMNLRGMVEGLPVYEFSAGLATAVTGDDCIQVIVTNVCLSTTSGGSGSGSGGSTGSVGPLSPSGVYLSEDWTTPEGAFSSGGDVATYTVAATETSHTLGVDDFTIAVPGSSITGILVEVLFACDPEGGVDSLACHLTTSGVDNSDVKLILLPDSGGYLEFGGDGDLWNGTWTFLSIVNLGVEVWGTAGAAEVELQVDHIRVTIFYSGGTIIPGGSGGDSTAIVLTVEKKLMNVCTGEILAEWCENNPDDCCDDGSGSGSGSGPGDDGILDPGNPGDPVATDCCAAPPASVTLTVNSLPQLSETETPLGSWEIFWENDLADTYPAETYAPNSPWPSIPVAYPGPGYTVRLRTNTFTLFGRWYCVATSGSDLGTLAGSPFGADLPTGNYWVFHGYYCPLSTGFPHYITGTSDGEGAGQPQDVAGNYSDGVHEWEVPTCEPFYAHMYLDSAVVSVGNISMILEE